MEFKIEINAPRKRVWEILWGEKTYPIWTTAFSEGSRVETDWKKGSKAIFLDDQNGGMVSRIAENIPHEYMSIEHLGYYKDGFEDYEAAKAEKWAGALENYTLKDLGNKTELHIHMDMAEDNQEMVAMFEKIWPKALENIKDLAEK